MSFIPADLGDVKEAEAVAEGEYDLRIVSAKEEESKKGNPMIACLIRIEDAGIPNPAPVRHWLLIPQADTPADQRQMRLLEMKRFLQCFGIPWDPKGFDVEDFNGATGRATLVQETNEETGDVFNKLRLPKLRDNG